MGKSVVEWYAGQSILVTGATGFMGKVLVEKLLRDCDGISKIYILVRAKGGETAEQRVEKILKSAAFDKIRTLPDCDKKLSKLHGISGDVTKPNADLSAADIEMLQNTVTIVFHMAANVRFDNPLKTALMLNTGGTYTMLEMALKFKKLEAFVHASTAFCHCHLRELKEKTYKSPHSPKQILETATWMDEEVLFYITPRLLGHSPHTYAYTKNLSEQLIKNYASKLPLAIARPSIVTSSWKEPMPGWVDNLNGPAALMMAAAKGVVRSLCCNPKMYADFIPVDVAINNLILIGWELAHDKQKYVEEPLVVNVSIGHDNPLTWEDAFETSRKHFYEYPFSRCLWYPCRTIQPNYWIHILSVFLFHTLPAYFLDFVFNLAGYKPFFVRIQKRISSGLRLLLYYSTQTFYFDNQKIKKIRKGLSQEDNDIFYTDITELNWDDYMLDYCLGIRKYCVKQDLELDLQRGRKVLTFLYTLDTIKSIILWVVIFTIAYIFAVIFFTVIFKF